MIYSRQIRIYSQKILVSGIVTAPTYLDVFVPASVEWSTTVPAGHNGFVYVFEGEGVFGTPGKHVKTGELGGMQNNILYTPSNRGES